MSGTTFYIVSLQMFNNMKKSLRRIGKILGVVAICLLAYLVYAFRFAPHLQKIYGPDGRVKFGYDRIQGKWLFNEYQHHELDIDGPHIFRDAQEIVYVKGSRKKYNIVSEKYAKLPDSLTCYISEEDTFRFALQQEYHTDTCIYPMPAKLFALSDIEGNFKAFKGLLTGNGITDSNLSWTFGNGHLVLVGDFVDRGTEVTQCLWLIYKLEQEAEKQGGKVHYILGNHEALNFYGDVRYVKGKYLELARRRKMLYAQLFSTGTELGKWMRTKNTIEKIGDIIFVHGGISPMVAAKGYTVPQINAIARSYIDVPYKTIQQEDAALLMAKKGILWYRGLVTVYGLQKLSMVQVDDIMNRMHCKTIAVGHTVVPAVSKDFDGKVIRLNVKHASCEPEALYIENGKYYATNTKGERKPL